jgi:hypothetical protein
MPRLCFSAAARKRRQADALAEQPDRATRAPESDSRHAAPLGSPQHEIRKVYVPFSKMNYVSKPFVAP